MKSHWKYLLFVVSLPLFSHSSPLKKGDRHLTAALISRDFACRSEPVPVFQRADRHARCGEPIRRTEDVIYGRKYGMALTLDVFQPAQPNGCGLLFLVNGGWMSSKATPLMVTIRPDDYRVYLERGYTVSAVVTSSQPKFAIPELVDDVQRAVRFVRSSAAKYGVRPDRLGVLGASSGGHLTLSIATRDGPGTPAIFGETPSLASLSGSPSE